MSETSLSFRLGVKHSLQILLIEPFFEEANRCRRLIAQMMRALDDAGIGSTIATLPGAGESLSPVDQVRLADWRAALGTLRADCVASLRGGALIDDAASAACHWRFAPETGARLVRDLRRTQLTGTSLYAGNRLSDAFLADLEGASPAPLPRLRTIRLENDAGEADSKVDGSPLWRRAEPGEDSALAQALAADLADWVKLCAAS